MANSLPLEKTRTPGIYKRGSRFVVTFRDPDGRARKKFAATYTEAKTLKARIAADVSRDEYLEPTTREEFATYARRWIATYPGAGSKGIRPETREDYRVQLERDAIPLLGRKRLGQIDKKALTALAERVASGPLCRRCRGRGFDELGRICTGCQMKGRIPEDGAISANTVRLALAPVKAMLGFATEQGELRRNPAIGFRTRYTQKPEGELEEESEDVKALDDEQLAALFEALEAKEEWRRWRRFFEFLTHTGLRIGEAIELRWKDVDFGQRTLRVERRFYRGKVGRPKSAYGRRTLALTPGLVQQLWLRWAEEKPDPEELVFTSERGARIDQSNLMSRVLKPAAVTAGIGSWAKTKGGRRAETWVGFHSFRHTCATLLFTRERWNAVQVQRWLGHHKPSFTVDTYVHLLPKDVTAPSFMDGLVGNEGDAGATRAPETAGEPAGEAAAEIAGVCREEFPVVSVRLTAASNS
jgi:integrase